jgi:hypothetical protein
MENAKGYVFAEKTRDSRNTYIYSRRIAQQAGKLIQRFRNASIISLKGLN